MKTEIKLPASLIAEILFMICACCILYYVDLIFNIDVFTKNLKNTIGISIAIIASIYCLLWSTQDEQTIT